MVNPGEEVALVGVNAGRGLQRRLADMGLYPGANLKVIQSHPGPIIVQVGNSRFGLGYGMAQKIVVKEV
jgi:ferrous iron transport protein A